MEIKFSVITSTFNSERYIENCIKSVHNQIKYSNYEHIIIDNQSVDKTKDIVNKYSQIIFLSEKDNGIYDAWNKGIEIASGEYVIFLSSDDEMHNNKVFYDLNNQIHNIDAIFHSNVCRINSLGEVIMSKNNSIFDPPIIRIPPHPSTIYPLSILKKNKFDKNYKICGDTEHYFRIKNSVKINFLNLTTVNFRIGGVSNQRKYSLLKWKEKNFIRLKYKISIPKKLIYMSFIKAIINQFIISWLVK